MTSAAPNNLPTTNEAKIILNHVRPAKFFTNKDTVAGKLRLEVATELSASSIIIKLEGESKTIVSGVKPSNNRKRQDKPVTEIEAHKLLYQSAKVFPPKELITAQQTTAHQTVTPTANTTTATEPKANLAVSGTYGDDNTTGQRGFFGSSHSTSQNASNSTEKEYTLSPGIYEYDFSFTLPLKNHCVIDLKGFTNKFAFGQGGLINPVNRNQELIKHVSYLLPPSLPRVIYDNDSAIQYYIKATIKRSSFYKQNIRIVEPFRFVPLDLAYSLPETQKLSYTRLGFDLKLHLGSEIGSVNLPFYFETRYNYPGYVLAGNGASSNDEKHNEAIRPNISFYLLTTTAFPQMVANGSAAANIKLIIDSLKLELVATTTLLAEELRQSVPQKFVIFDESFLNVNNPEKIVSFTSFKQSRGKNNAGEQLYELEIPSSLFASKFDYKVLNLPNLVPSFKTCNVKRDYKLVAHLTFRTIDGSTGLVNDGNTLNVKADPINLVLESEFKVSSGLAPPPGVTLESEADEHMLNNELVATTQTQAQSGPNPQTYAGTGSVVGGSTVAASTSSKPNLPPRTNNYEAKAGELTNKLASKLTKFSLKLGEDNPKYATQANKFSSFINKQNTVLQLKLNSGANTSTGTTTTGTTDSTTDLSTASFHGDDLAGDVPVVTTAGTAGNPVKLEQQQSQASGASRPNGPPPVVAASKPSDNPSTINNSINTAGLPSTSKKDEGKKSEIVTNYKDDYNDLPPPPAYEESIPSLLNASSAPTNVSSASTGNVSFAPAPAADADALPVPNVSSDLPGYGQSGPAAAIPLDLNGYPIDRKDNHLAAYSKLNSTNSEFATPEPSISPVTPPPTTVASSSQNSTNAVPTTTFNTANTSPQQPTPFTGLPTYEQIPDKKPPPPEKGS